MSRTYSILSIISVVLITLGWNTSQAAEVVTIVTPVPKATCTEVPAHYEGNTWVSTHNVCRYENRVEGVAWVGEYWQCVETKGSECVRWELQPGHWVKTLE